MNKYDLCFTVSSYYILVPDPNLLSLRNVNKRQAGQAKPLFHFLSPLILPINAVRSVDS